VALPNPLPDNPARWDGWKNFNSPNLYERLCLDFDSNASGEQIEENCRQLLVWWQKKLPLKNQMSNPVAQMLRGGLDEAPLRLAEARTELLNPEARTRIDAELRKKIVGDALAEFRKLIQFSLGDGKLTGEAEKRLLDAGRASGLGDQEVTGAIEEEMMRLGAKRVEAAPAPAPVVAAAREVPAATSADPFGEFRRLLRMSRLAGDGGEMTDDQRDAMCNLGESLGLTGGQAEDLIDEYLDEMEGLAPAPVKAPAAQPQRAVAAPKPAAQPAPIGKVIKTSPLARSEERAKYHNFTNTIGCEMFLVTSGMFAMGSIARESSAHERPITRVTMGCFYMARFPTTNVQYEKFDTQHCWKRAPNTDDNHPVVFVTSLEAEKFCQWLSQREGRKYRLPTEAEWEYAARGLDGRIYPWGEVLDAGHYANFADANTNFPWREPNFSDGFAEAAPVGSFPRGASPFGIEDLAGNVFEWCLDYFEAYRGGEIVNRRGPNRGAQRVYRGGSWRSRASSLRASARHFNLATYSANDVGFRLVCEVE
jgi:formylglycine-generating enzyme required for sulfatase activity